MQSKGERPVIFVSETGTEKVRQSNGSMPIPFAGWQERGNGARERVHYDSMRGLWLTGRDMRNFERGPWRGIVDPESSWRVMRTQQASS